MTVYKINQEGVEALHSTANALNEAAGGLDSASSGLLNSVQEYEDSIGPHAQSINDAVEGIQASLKQAVEPIEGVTSKLGELAAQYEEIIGNDRFKKSSS